MAATPRRRAKVFVGSSTESLPIARAIQSNLGREFRVKLWNDDVFSLTHSGLEGLMRVLDWSDAGVFVLEADDITTMRGESAPSTRTNVLLELGMFLGRHGRERTFMATPQGGPRPPSDLDGITPATYVVELDGSIDVGIACNQVRTALANPVVREESPSRARLDRAMKTLGCDMEDLLGAASPAAAEDASLTEPMSFPLGQATVSVLPGKIEDFVAEDPADVVLLPANEYFDDRCFTDSRSSLGAYVAHHFADGEAVLGAVHAVLEHLPSEQVKRKSNVVGDSYGIGQAIHLHDLEPRILVASATTERAGIGLRAEPHFLYATLQGAVEVMNEERLRRLTMPVLGAGHGAMPTSVALLFNLLALKGILADDLGRHIERVQIVVYERSADKVAPQAIQDILAKLGTQVPAA